MGRVGSSLRNSAPKERYNVGHGTRRGSRRFPSPSLPSPARAGEACPSADGRGDGHSLPGLRPGLRSSAPSGLRLTPARAARISQRSSKPGHSQRHVLVFRSLLISILFSAVPHAAAVESPIRYEASHPSMGTVYTVAAYGSDAEFLAETVNEVFEEVDRLDAQMSNYKPASELSRINREAAREDVVVEPQLFGLIQLCLHLSEDTGGAFDITVGPLMKAWGFFRGQGRVPSPQEIRDVLKDVGYG